MEEERSQHSGFPIHGEKKAELALFLDRQKKRGEKNGISTG